MIEDCALHPQVRTSMAYTFVRQTHDDRYCTMLSSSLSRQGRHALPQRLTIRCGRRRNSRSSRERNVTKIPMIKIPTCKLHVSRRTPSASTSLHLRRGLLQRALNCFSLLLPYENIPMNRRPSITAAAAAAASCVQHPTEEAPLLLLSRASSVVKYDIPNNKQLCPKLHTTRAG